METEKAETEPSRDTVSSSQRTPDRESHKLTRKEKTPNKSPASTNRVIKHVRNTMVGGVDVKMLVTLDPPLTLNLHLSWGL